MQWEPPQRPSWARDHFLKNREIKKKQVLAITISGPIGRFVNLNTTMPKIHDRLPKKKPL
jgi:hypothetical protein